jgi:hypothetical protein
MELIERWIAAFRETFDTILDASASLAPNLFAAAVLLVAGWVIARMLRMIIWRLGDRVDAALQPARERVGLPRLHLRWPVSQVLGHVVFWIVILFFVMAVAGTLNLPGVVVWLRRVIDFIPAIIAATIIIVAGYWISGALGRLVRSAAETAGYAQPAILERAISAFVLVVAVIIGLEQLRFDITLLVNLITIAVGALLAGLALAFGIGAGPSVANVMAARYVARNYSVGQRVRVGGVEGTILEISSTTVILETDGGRAFVPAQNFQKDVSMQIDPEDASHG